jgi:Cu-Zn family superoxide dismutase
MYTATETGDGRGDFIGTVVFTDSQEYGGVIITPDLNSIPPGVHGFHIHEYPNCSPKMHDGHETPALAAGGHFDPENTGKHLGPYADGHLGDLPILFVSTEGTATHTMYAPRLRAADIKNHSLMIHAGGDNYSDTPNALGGGGARLACGVVE